MILFLAQAQASKTFIKKVFYVLSFTRIVTLSTSSNLWWTHLVIFVGVAAHLCGKQSMVFWKKFRRSFIFLVGSVGPGFWILLNLLYFKLFCHWSGLLFNFFVPFLFLPSHWGPPSLAECQQGQPAINNCGILKAVHTKWIDFPVAEYWLASTCQLSSYLSLYLHLSMNI